MIVFVLSFNLLSCAFAKNIGFDPGMNVALAASTNPNNPKRYVESCPDSPTGKCYGTIQPGGGFYTLPNDADSDSYWEMTKTAFEDMFEWKRDGNGDLIAQLTIDSRNFPTPWTPNLYTGLQLNLPIRNSYAGMDYNNRNWTVPSSSIKKADLQFRAVVCPNANDDYFLTLHYYNDRVVNTKTCRVFVGFQLLFLMEYS